MACEYASTTTCECRVLQVSCHTLLALQLRQLHVALHGAGWVAGAGVEEAAFGAQSCGLVQVDRAAKVRGDQRNFHAGIAGTCLSVPECARCVQRRNAARASSASESALTF
jgi:hypothetical protein